LRCDPINHVMLNVKTRPHKKRGARKIFPTLPV
jgi:hypothetical protein